MFKLTTHKTLGLNATKQDVIMEIDRWIDQIQNIYLRAYQAKDLIASINSLLNLTLFAVEISSVELMIDILLFIIDNCLYFSAFDTAIGIAMQLINLCDFNGIEKPKILIYMKIADICVKMKEYHRAIKFLQKGLELCWYFKEFDRELHIYDRIGYCYFMLAELEVALAYHSRAWEGQFEPLNSDNRNTVIDSINREKLVETKSIFHDVSAEALNQLSLTPVYFRTIKSLFEDDYLSLKRMYRYKGFEVDDREDVMKKLKVEGFRSLTTFLPESKTCLLGLLQCDNLLEAIDDLLHTPKLKIFYNCKYTGEKAEKPTQDAARSNLSPNRVHVIPTQAEIAMYRRKKMANLHNVVWYAQNDDKGEYIKPVVNVVASNINTDYLNTHLSPNRNLAEYYPCFSGRNGDLHNFFGRVFERCKQLINNIV
mgnify:CR=1 FL=1